MIFFQIRIDLLCFLTWPGIKAMEQNDSVALPYVCIYSPLKKVSKFC